MSFNSSGVFRPNATGISVYIPHNVFSNEIFLEYRINQYSDIIILWGESILNDYIPFVQSDTEAPGLDSYVKEVRTPTNNEFSALTITHDDDLEHVHIVLDEEFFIVNEDAVIFIENGNEDLVVEHVPLEPGNYHIGYSILDHSHNDTLIWDLQTFVVTANDVKEILADNEIQLFPNPANQGFYLNLDEKYAGEAFTLQLTDLQGRTVLTEQIRDTNVFINTGQLPNSMYTYTLYSDNVVVYRGKVVVQH